MEGSFKKNLREELNYQGLTVKELSAKIGIPKPTIDCYLSSRQTMPPADIAVKIAKALNVSVEFLVTGTNEQPAQNSRNHMTELDSMINDFERLSDTIKKSLAMMIHTLAVEKAP